MGKGKTFSLIALACAVFFVGLVPVMASANIPSIKDMFVAAGAPEASAVGLAQFAKKVGASEGNWNSVSSSPCVGMFQFCVKSGTYRQYIGRAWNGAPPSPQEQVNAWFRYIRDQWAQSGRIGIRGVIGRDVCSSHGRDRGQCITATQSSVIMACQFGCGSNGAPHNYVRNGFACTNDKYPKSGRDGNSVCTETYMYRGAGFDVSYITGMEPDELNAVRRSDGKVVNDPECGAGNDPNLLLLPGSACASIPGSIPPPKCPDINLVAGTTLATKAYQHAAIAAAQESYRAMEVTDLSACLIRLETYFDAIKNILAFTFDGILSSVAILVMNVLQGLLSAACEYVVNGINNLLASVCLPVPNLSLNLDFNMKSVTRQSCDGLSLLNVMSVNGGGAPFPSALPRLNVNGMSLGAETLMRRRQ